MKSPRRLFLLANSFFVLALGMFGPIYAIFVQQIGGDILDAGAAWSIFMIISGVGMLIMGKVQDMLKREKPMILLGYGLRSSAYLGYLFVSNVWHLFIVQIFLGLSAVVITPASDSFYTKYLEKGKFASQWAAWESLFFIISGVAAIIGAFIVKLFGFRILFLGMFLVSLLGLFFASWLEDKDEN